MRSVFDPFFGFFFPAIVPADVILGSDTVTKFGLNIGGGLAFRIGQGRTKVFVEALPTCTRRPSRRNKCRPPSACAGSAAPFKNWNNHLTAFVVIIS